MKPPVFREWWSDEVRAVYAHDVSEIWDPTIAPHTWNQYHNQLDFYLSLAGGEALDILDVGCAQGTLALKLAEAGHRVTAVDLRQEFLDYAQARHTHGAIRFVRANALEDDLPGRYSLIFANQIIEHLVHPLELLQRLSGKLEPGGRIVVTTPNGAYVRNGLPSFTELGDVARWEHLQHTADSDGHFFAYRRAELLDIFRRAGFRNATAAFFETPFISGHMKLRHLHRHAPVRLLRMLDRAVLSVPGLRDRLAHQLLVTASAGEPQPPAGRGRQ